MRWPRYGAWTVAGVTLAGFLVAVATHWGVAPLPELAVGLGTALLFVVLFTRLAGREREARERAEALGRQLEATAERLRRHAVDAEELAAERERTRVAREIHDAVGHALTVVSIQLEAALAVGAVDAGRARTAVARAGQAARDGLAEIRRAVTALRASPLEGRALGAAIGELGEVAGDVEVAVLGAARRLEPAAELALYRTAQEGLTNARRHAPGAAVRLILDYRSAAAVRLEVADDGPGLAAPLTEGAGFGLVGLRERAAHVGGELRVASEPGRGFVLALEVPG